MKPDCNWQTMCHGYIHPGYWKSVTIAEKSLFMDYPKSEVCTLMIYIAFVLLSQIVELDLSTVAPSVSGPKRPHDRVSVSVMKQDFTDCLNNKVGFKGFGIPPEKQSTEVPFIFDGQEFKLAHGKNSYLSLNLFDIYVYFIIIIIIIVIITLLLLLL